MCSANGTHDGDFGYRAAEHSGVGTITRSDVVDQGRRLHGFTHGARRDEYLDAVFLGVRSAFGARAGDEYAVVLEQDGLRVVEVVDGGVGQDVKRQLRDVVVL
jgi:hypothetical protein